MYKDWVKSQSLFIIEINIEYIKVIFIEAKNEQRVLSQSDLYEILPFGKTKTQQLIKSGQLPLMKVGKDYITTFNILERWIGEHVGEEIYY